MGSAKDIVLHRIDARFANAFIKQHHYSGKVVNNSKLHLGVFLFGRCLGVMSFGPPLDKSKVIGLVKGTKWDEVLELNRMAFHELLPKNSESRALAVSMRLVREYIPTVRWCLSYADATQCGCGTIYRAAGFTLTGIKPNKNLAKIGGRVVHKMTLESSPTKRISWLGGKTYFEITGGKYDWRGFVKTCGGEVLTGYQIRYIYFLDKTARGQLAVEEINYREIKRIKASMYKGARSIDSDAPCDQ